MGRLTTEPVPATKSRHCFIAAEAAVVVAVVVVESMDGETAMA